jgi:molecular chaperone GrpE
VSKEKTRPQPEPKDDQPGQDAPAEGGSAAEQAAVQANTLAAERDEYKDRWMRQLAEFDNYKKRAERERADFLRRANEGMVKDLLPALDNLERAMEHAQAHGEENPLAQGIRLTHQDLVKVLERHGLEKVEALGQPFNPEFHEAMLQQEDPDQEDNTVLRELGRGYVFQGRLLRPAMVVVSKRPAASDDDGTEVKINIS